MLGQYLQYLINSRLRAAIWLASILLTGFAVLTFASTPSAEAAVPTYINYQSRLRSYPSLSPVTTETTIQFSVYNHATNGVPGDAASDHYTAGTTGLLWKESHTVTPDAQGYFSVKLGSVTPFPSYLRFSTDPLYVGVKVGTNNEAAPRAQIGGSPFAYSVGMFSADSSSGFLRGERTGIATVGTQGYNSAQVILQGSGWTGAAAANREIKLQNTITSASAYRFSILNNSNDELLGLDQGGALTLAAPSATATAITITDTDYTNALSIGDNNIIGTTAAIDFDNFDVASDGDITTTGTLAVNGDEITADGATLVINAGGTVDIQDALTVNSLTTDTGGVSVPAGQGIDTAAAGTLNIGNANATGVAICNSTDCDTLEIGLSADADVIKIGDVNDVVTIESAAWSINSTGDLTVNSCIGCGGGVSTLQGAYDGGNIIETASNTSVVITETSDSHSTNDLLHLRMYPGSGYLASGSALQITMDGLTTNGTSGDAISITIDQSQSTGRAFVLKDDASTPYMEISEIGFIEFNSFDAGDQINATNGNADYQVLVVDATSTAITDTAGLIDLNINAGNAAVDGINVGLTSNNGVTAGTDIEGIAMDITGNDADADHFGMRISFATTAAAVSGTYEAGILINNADTTASSLNDGVLVTATGVNNGVVDAFDASAANITNALNAGANVILGTTATINFDNFDVASTGAITVVAGQGLDTAAAGTLNIGTTTSNNVTIGNATTTTALNFNSGTSAQKFTSQVTTGSTTTSAFVFDATAVTSGTGLYLTTDSITSGKLADITTTGNTWTGDSGVSGTVDDGLVNIASSSTAGSASDESALLFISRSGANANASHRAYGGFFSVTNTGTSNSNVGLMVKADGGSTNDIGIQVGVGGGSLALPSVETDYGLLVNSASTETNSYGLYASVTGVAEQANYGAYLNVTGATAGSVVVDPDGTQTILTNNYGLTVIHGRSGFGTGSPSAVVNISNVADTINVKADANGYNAVDALVVNGGTGGATTYAGASSIAGAGAGVSSTSGIGGDNTATMSGSGIFSFHAGLGGELTLATGTGGEFTGAITNTGGKVDTYGGNGGALNMTGGTGGRAFGTLSPDGNLTGAYGRGGIGGAIAIAAGTGGAANGALTSVNASAPANYAGAGGSLVLSSGAGGVAAGADGSKELAVGGNGGLLQIRAGNGGSATASGFGAAQGGAGGSIEISAGSAVSTGGEGGKVSIWAGTGTGAANGAVYIGGNLTTPYSTVYVNLAQSIGSKAVCNASGGTTGMLELSDCASSPAADYMEMYPTADDVETGDVVTVGSEDVKTDTGDNIKQLVKSTTAYDNRLIGVASNPEMASDFNSQGYNIKETDRPYPIALVGRVRVKISENSEDILPGDLLTSSTEPGRAMKSTQPGQTIGKALESWSAAKPTDTIMMFVTTSYADANNSSQRYKTNINGLTYGLNDLMLLRPVSFDWKSTGASDIGFIAEEVSQVNPNLVYKNSKGQVEGVNYKMMSVLLTKAVQEQQLQIENLSSLVAINMAMDRSDELIGGEIRIVDTEVTGNLTVAGQVNLGADSVGQATVLEGAREVRVTFETPYTYQPIVTITPTGVVALETSVRYAVTNANAYGFTISIDEAVDDALTFNWHAFAAKEARVFVSDGTTREINLIVDDQPEDIDIIVEDDGSGSGDSGGSSDGEGEQQLIEEPPVEGGEGGGVVPPADEPPAEEPPAEQPPADEPPTEEPPADIPPAE